MVEVPDEIRAPGVCVLTHAALSGHLDLDAGGELVDAELGR